MDDKLRDAQLDAKLCDAQLDAKPNDAELDAKSHDAQLDTRPRDAQLNAKSHDAQLDAKPHDAQLNAKSHDAQLDARWSKPCDVDAVLGKQDRKRFIIKADGNCMFRSLSFYFFGSENKHSTLRSLLVKFIETNSTYFTALVFTGSFSQHVASMKCPGIWGTQVELQAAASLAQTPIYVLTKQGTEGADYKWIMYQPQSIANLKFPDELSFLFKNTLNHLEICHTNGNHYDCVINTMDQCSTIPPFLLEYHEHVNDVL